MDLNKQDTNVSDFANLISSQDNHIKQCITQKTSGKATILEQSLFPTYPEPTFGPLDSHVRTSQAYKKEQEITNHEEAKKIVSISPSCEEITAEDLTELYTLKCADLVSEIAECKKSGKYKNLAESLGREAILNTMLVNKLKIKVEVNREAKKYAKKLGRWDLWR